MLVTDAEILARQQGIHRHAAGILRQEHVKVGPHLFAHALGREKRIDKVAEVKHLGKTPVAAIADLILAELVLLGREYSLGDVLVLDVIDLVPRLVTDGQGLEIGLIQQRDDAQHLLVVLVVAHHLAVGVEKRHIDPGRKLLAEFVNVHRLVVGIDLRVAEGFPGHKIHDIVLLVDADHRAVHPGFIFGHQSQIGERIVEDHGKQAVIKNQVTLDEQRVVLHHLVLDQRQRIDVVGLVIDGILSIFNLQPPLITVTDVVDELLAFITHYHH